MKRKRLILSVALGVLAAGVIVFLLREPSEPVFEGQKLGYWIRKSLNSTDTKLEDQAERAVKAAGTNALPYLLDQFTRRTSRWARPLNHVSKQFHGRFHAETEDERISVAVFGLTALGPDMAHALPTLAKELVDPRRGSAAALLMCRCDDKALPYFRELIKSTNGANAIWMAASLCHLDDAGRFPLPLMENLLSDPESEIRRKAVVALSSSIFDPDTAVRLLNRSLFDSELEVQIAAAVTLGKLKPDAAFAKPLQTLMTNSNERLAQAASNALQLINAPAIPSRRPVINGIPLK